MELDGNVRRSDHWEETKSNIANLPPSELRRLVKKFKTDTNRMKMENLVLENFLKENDPGLICGMEKTMQHLQSIQTKLISTTSLHKAPSSDPKCNEKMQDSVDSNAPSLSEQKLKGPRINFNLKMDLVLREIESIQTNLKQFKESSRRFKNKMKAEIEENGIRGDEITETFNNFEQQIVIEGVEELTQKIPAEKWVRYLQEWLKSSVFILEKLRLRRNNLRGTLRKLKGLFAQKEELGETVTEADFEQLSISNKNFLKEIDLKNSCIQDIKRMSGTVNLNLTNHKDLLRKQESFTKSMENKLVQINKQKDLLNLHYLQTKDELGDKQKKFDHITNIIKTYKAPDVMEYIKKKNELAEIKKRLKVWNRKVNIQNIVLHTYCNAMCQLTNSPMVKNEWLTKKIIVVDDDFLPEDLNLVMRRGKLSKSNFSRSNSRCNSKFLIKK